MCIGVSFNKAFLAPSGYLEYDAAGAQVNVVQ